MKQNRWMCKVLMLSFCLSLTNGCSGSADEVVVPNAPPLSAEAAKARAQQQQQQRVKSLQRQSKKKGK